MVEDAAEGERPVPRDIEIDPVYSGARIALVNDYLSNQRWDEAAAELDALEKRRDSLTPAMAARVDRSRAETLRHRSELEPLHGYPPFEELLKPKG